MALIDAEKLDAAYREDRVYALQLEVGDICHQGCSYCYMNALPEQKNALSDRVIGEIIDDARRLDIAAIEWLGGEPLLRDSIFEAMAHAAGYGMRNNIWTGGLVLAERDILKQTCEATQRGLIAIHVSSIHSATYKQLHPDRPEDDLHKILHAVEELLALGYPPEQVINSVTFTGVQSADDMIETMDYFEERFGILTSLNVYHTYLRPGESDEALTRFIPGTGAVARVYRHYARQYGEKEVPMNCVNKQYCSATAAVLSDGSVTPCATIRPKDAPSVNKDGTFYDIFHRHREDLIFTPFKRDEKLPDECRVCNLSDTCWGCRSRSYAAGLGMYGRDPRCFRNLSARVKRFRQNR